MNTPASDQAQRKISSPEWLKTDFSLLEEFTGVITTGTHSAGTWAETLAPRERVAKGSGEGRRRICTEWERTSGAMRVAYCTLLQGFVMLAKAGIQRA